MPEHKVFVAEDDIVYFSVCLPTLIYNVAKQEWICVPITHSLSISTVALGSADITAIAVALVDVWLLLCSVRHAPLKIVRMLTLQIEGC